MAALSPMKKIDPTRGAKGVFESFSNFLNAFSNLSSQMAHSRGLRLSEKLTPLVRTGPATGRGLPLRGAVGVHRGPRLREALRRGAADDVAAPDRRHPDLRDPWQYNSRGITEVGPMVLWTWRTR